MTESRLLTNNRHHCEVKPRSDSRIIRRALDEVQAIRTLLDDVYKDFGDGRTLLRELVQNADDAEAEHLIFAVVEKGWPEAQNSLLRGPALLVANDGQFPERDHEALHLAIGGSKAEDAGKVGRFGIGLKSVFHICEAFAYVGAENGVLRPGALNPWAGTGSMGDADPLHPDWDSIGESDLEKLLEVASILLGRFDNGLLLWIPLRQPAHLDRAEDREHGLRMFCPKPNDIAVWFGRSTSLALLLAQCGHLVSIEALRAKDTLSLETRIRLAYVVRPSFQHLNWIGRYEDDTAPVSRIFEGYIEDGKQKWSVFGVDTLGLERLRLLREDPEWPTDDLWQNGTCSWVQRKALAHAAITVLHPSNLSDGQCGAHLRWAVFLPLDDGPSPENNTIVESVGHINDPNAWNIIMHGYFWPSHDRRSIPGVTDNSSDGGGIRVRWNQTLRDELLLPLLPEALAHAIKGIPEEFSRSLIHAINESQIVCENLPAINRKKALLPTIAEKGIHWEVYPVDELHILSIPKWSEAPSSIRKQFVMQVEKYADNFVFIDGSAPRIGGGESEWPIEWIERLLSCISLDVLRTVQGLIWIEALLSQLLRSQEDIGSRDSAVARWLSAHIGEGVLTKITSWSSGETKIDGCTLWRKVFARLPADWLVETPVATQRAVIELAQNGITGPGLLLIPFGSHPNTERGHYPSRGKIDCALFELGKRLKKDGETSQRTYMSRLLLAEALLSIRGETPSDDNLSRLPLLRARRLPDNRDEAWSINDLYGQANRYRVFAKTNKESNTIISNACHDSKQAVDELAKALNEEVWLISSTLTSVTNIPTATATALAQAVLSNGKIRSNPGERKKLLLRLAKSEDDNPQTVGCAIVTLLTGRVPSSLNESDLYYVHSNDPEKAENQETLRILLHLLGKSQCSVQAELVEPIPHRIVETLNIKRINSEILHKLLQESIDKSVNWSGLDRSEVIHLLRRLYSAEYRCHERWCSMPIHKMAGDGRDIIGKSTQQAVSGLTLPQDLESEINLLEPDPEVAELYRDIPPLDHDGLLRAILLSPRPYRFVKQIIFLLRADDDSRIVIPRDPDLFGLLKDTEWLPHCEKGTGLAPGKLLILPEELQKAVMPLAGAGAIGDYRLTYHIAQEVRGPAEEIVKYITRDTSGLRQIHRLSDALAAFRNVIVEGGAYCLLPNADAVDAKLISCAMRSPLADSHAGWALVRSAIRAVGCDDPEQIESASASAQDAVVRMARSLCGIVPVKHQISVLKAIAICRPAKESPLGWAFQKFMETLSQTAGFIDHVLPYIELPTQDGQWHNPREIARSASGVARPHRLISDFRNMLRLDEDVTVQHESKSEARKGAGSAEMLESYFEPWADRVPSAAVGVFLSMLGNGKDNAILDLAQRWLGDDVSVEGMRQSLTDRVNFDSVRVSVLARIASGDRVKTLNLLGEEVEMQASSEDETIFAVDPVYKNSWFWEITLRDVEPSIRTSQQLIALLEGTVMWWANRALRTESHAVKTWWAQWGTGSQAQVGPVYASILSNLPLILHQLDVGGCPLMKESLLSAQQAQRKREQDRSAQANDNEYKALIKLASLIRENHEHQRFVWKRIKELIRRYGYREDSILLELSQNADDALSQSAEIAGNALPIAVKRLVVRVTQHGGLPTIDVIHYGRPINDTGGSAFPEGRNRMWDQDLYYMMVMNLSGKPGEESGQSTVASTTGRFGLGFKTVHLVSENPSIVSGFLAFSIVGGLLPIEQPIPEDPDLEEVEKRRATRVRIPLSCDIEPSKMIDKIFSKFVYARALLPAFAREIRHIIVEGGPCPGISTFEGFAIDGAPGWTVSLNTVSLPNHGQWRLMRFRPADANGGHGTEALIIGVREGYPEGLPSEVPFLWNVTPTSEGWGCGYAVNGPFKLDPGRTHVSLDDAATIRVVNLLGESLGRGLVKLHDTLVNSSCPPAEGLPFGLESREFLASVWKILATGIDCDDPLRRKFLNNLQGPGRGISAWMSARTVVPSDLPEPFSPFLPALGPNTAVEFAAGGLNNTDLCQAFAQIDDITKIAQKHHVTSKRIIQVLYALLNVKQREIRPADLLNELAESWGNVLTPERLQALRPLREKSIWQETSNSYQEVTWNSKLMARSEAGKNVYLKGLLLPKDLNITAPDSDIEDEKLRAGFAPDSVLLAKEYISNQDDMEMFIRLRVRHEINASKMASWFADPMFDRDKQLSGLGYLLYGTLKNEVLERLIPFESRPSWLNDYEAITHMLQEICQETWRYKSILIALFPERFDISFDYFSKGSLLPESKRHKFFDDLKKWWDEPNVRREVIGSYERKAWPDWLRDEGLAAGLRSHSRDHWLGLLVLGACRSIGRTQAGHHRAFLESARREGWWNVFTDPDNIVAWMEMLRTWQDMAVGSLNYPQWMSLFPSIYQLSRYLDTYRRLLLSSGKRPEHLYNLTVLLAPRVDEALTGAGLHFNAPPAPLNMGLNWVLRELVRLGLIDEEHIFPDCWVPSEQVLSFLYQFGFSLPEGNISNSGKAKAVSRFLASELKIEVPHLHRAFDIPLRYIQEHQALRQHFELED